MRKDQFDACHAEIARLRAEREELREVIALASVLVRRIGTVDANSTENIRRADKWISLAGRLLSETSS